MQVRRAATRAAFVAVAAVVLAACPSPPPAQHPTGVVDLGPLGSYGWSGNLLSLIPNVFQRVDDDGHQILLHVTGDNGGLNDQGGIQLTRRDAEVVPLPTVGHYETGAEGWTVSVFVNRRVYEATSMTITEVSYGPPHNESPDPERPELVRQITRLRATFTFLLPDGQEASGFVRVN